MCVKEDTVSLSQKERVIAQIKHQETDRVPYSLTFEDGVTERLDAFYGNNSWRGKLDNAILWAPGADLGISAGDHHSFIDAYGSGWRTDRRPFYLVQPVLTNPSFDGLTWPNLDVLLDAKWLAKAKQFCADHADHFLVAGFGFGLFERTWTLRGFDEALTDAAGDPDFYEELVAKIADHQCAIIERLLQLPVDGIMFSDDWGYQQGVLLGPARWRRFIKPHLQRQYALVHQAGRYTLSHCCGSVVDILPDIIEIGLDVLESVQPEARGMNPLELKAKFGAQIAFWGGLGSQSTIPFGSPEEIRSTVATLRQEMGRGGGYILGPAKAIQPETPAENVAAVVESFTR